MSDGNRCPVTMRARVQAACCRPDREHPMRRRRTDVPGGTDGASRRHDAGTTLPLPGAASRSPRAPGAREGQAL